MGNWEVVGALPTAIGSDTIAIPVNTNPLGTPRRLTFRSSSHGALRTLGKPQRPDRARLPTMLTLNGIPTPTSTTVTVGGARDATMPTHLFEVMITTS